MEKGKSMRPPGRRRAKRRDSTPQGIILERFKRLRGLPSHSLDFLSETFMHHYLRTKHRAP